MKVYLVGPSVEQKGGVVSVIQQLMGVLEDKGVEYSFFPTTSDSTVMARVFLFFTSWFRLTLGCALRQVDVVHIHTASRGSFLRKSIIAISCLCFRVPYVLHLHGAEFQDFYDKELRRFGKSYLRFIFSRAASVIALSESWRSWLEENLKIKNVVVVFNGVPFFSGFSNQNSNPVILFMGRLSERKGVHDLIKVMPGILSSIPNAVLELAGDGDIEYFRKLTGGNPQIRFLGWLDDNQRISALSRATVFCLPSSNEGLPMSVLEAMSAGLPVVSTPVGGIPEAVVDGVTGLLVEPGDFNGLTAALSNILSDSEKAKMMGRSGAVRHKTLFSSVAMGQACLDVYKRCCRSS